MRQINIRLFDAKSLILFRRWFKRRSITRNEASLERRIEKLKTAATRREQQIDELQQQANEAESRRKYVALEVVERRRIADGLAEEVDKLRLTIDKGVAYSSELEDAIRKKDTEISLLRLELESLTLWREKINQQFRTEADIHAAKSKVLQGRNAQGVLENLTHADKANRI